MSYSHNYGPQQPDHLTLWNCHHPGGHEAMLSVNLLWQGNESEDVEPIHPDVNDNLEAYGQNPY